MKKRMLLSLSAALCMIAQQTTAQSNSYFYGSQITQTTTTDNPGNPMQDYAVTETMRDFIHLVRFDHFGGIMNIGGIQQSYWLMDQIGSAQNVDITPINTNLFLHTSYYRDMVNSPLTVQIRVAIIQFMGPNVVVLNQRLISSTDPVLNSLYALDAAYDQNMNRFVICGMAVHDMDDAPADQKEAFVLTLNGGLNPIRLEYYNSTPTNANDYDIATRVVPTNGRYYVTGSQNGTKIYAPFQKMEIRNMLIDPNTLDWSLPGTWDAPIALATDNDESGVDMIQHNGAFVLLFNFVQDFEYGIIHVNPATGAPVFLAPQIPFHGGTVAHSISRGNTPNELIIHGMKGFNGWLTDAEPFHGTVDLTTPYPVTAYNVTEYPTIIGNAAGANNYWTTAGFYCTQNGYPLPTYVPRFAQRAGLDFSVMAPIYEPTLTLLMHKFIFTNGGGNTQCPMSNASYMGPYYWFTPLNKNDVYNQIIPNEEPCQISVVQHLPIGTDKCTNIVPYYKQAQNEENNVPVLANAAKTENRIYPNPTSSIINIELRDNYISDISISLVDITGKRVADVYNGINSQKTISFIIPLGMANGIYHLKISSKGHADEIHKINIMR